MLPKKHIPYNYLSHHDIIYVMTASICVLLFSLTFASCKSESNPVYDLLKFRTEIRDHCAEYSEADWENALEEYEDICQRINEMNLSKEETLEVDKIKGEIAGYAAKVTVQQVNTEIQNIVDEIGSFADGFSKTFDD